MQVRDDDFEKFSHDFSRANVFRFPNAFGSLEMARLTKGERIENFAGPGVIEPFYALNFILIKG